MVEFLTILLWTLPLIIGIVVLELTTNIKATSLIIPIAMVGMFIYIFNLEYTEVTEEQEEVIVDFDLCFNDLMAKGYDEESTIRLCKIREQNLGG